jgi:hypothetical protein
MGRRFQQRERLLSNTDFPGKLHLGQTSGFPKRFENRLELVDGSNRKVHNYPSGELYKQ